MNYLYHNFAVSAMQTEGLRKWLFYHSVIKRYIQELVAKPLIQQRIQLPHLEVAKSKSVGIVISSI